jgi:ssDNA-binding Zn-finger/Zn-ribbon topoisomerase 1
MTADRRGKLHQCEKCATAFLVPHPGSSGGTVAASGDDVVAVLCPKCSKRLVLPSSMRGKPTSCTQCHTSFMVPKPQAAMAAAR